MNPWLPLPEEFQQRTDEELGRWLLASWVGTQADRAGIPRNAISTEWVEAVIRATVADEVDDVEYAALDNALIKACNGQFGRAGKMLRDIVMSGGAESVYREYASAGIEQSARRKRGSKKAAEAAKASASEWQNECADAARKLLQDGRAQHELSSMLARRFRKSATQVRMVLQKAGVLHPRKRRK